MKTKFISIFIVCLLFVASNVAAVEVALRISDREIIEKLTGLEAGQATLSDKMKVGQDTLGQRITDLREEMKAGQADLREEMKAGQTALRQEMKTGQDSLGQRITDLREEMKAGQTALRQEMKAGQDSLGQRITDLREDTREGFTSLRQTMLTLFTGLIALIVALFAYIAWDRQTMMLPMRQRIEDLERNAERHQEIENVNSSRIKKLLEALRELSKTDTKLEVVLRNFSLL